MAVTVTLDPNSMFKATPIIQSGDNLIFGLRRDSIMPDNSDVMVTVIQTSADQLPAIAYEFYGAAELWWVIAEINHIIDPMTEIIEGLILRIPSKERVQAILGT